MHKNSLVGRSRVQRGQASALSFARGSSLSPSVSPAPSVVSQSQTTPPQPLSPGDWNFFTVGYPAHCSQARRDRIQESAVENFVTERPRSSLPILVSSRKRAVEAKCSLACEYLSKEDYMDLLWTTLSEFPGEAGAEKPAICSGFKINRVHITKNSGGLGVGHCMQANYWALAASSHTVARLMQCTEPDCSSTLQQGSQQCQSHSPSGNP